MTRATWTLVLALLLPSTLLGDDWPEWLGPKRDGVWREEGILKKFPSGGPKVLWRKDIGGGYAGVEGLAELQDFMGDVIDLYPRCRVQGMRWVLVEARERVMPEVAPRKRPSSCKRR